MTGRREFETHASQLLAHLETNREKLSPLLILTHDYPDPDALASAWALQYLASAFDIEARIVYGGLISRAENKAMVKLLKMPVHKLKAGELRKHRHVALVDTQPRFENNPFPAARRASIIIDQHQASEEPVTDLALIDQKCGATCVIVAQALELRGLELPARLATAIAYGIVSDTLDLYRVTRQDVIQTYLHVLRQCDMRLLAEIQNPPRSRRFFATLGRSIQTAAAYRRVMVAHLGDVKSPESVAQVADFLLTYERVDWSFCTGRYRGGLYLSLRGGLPNAHASDVLRRVVDKPSQAGGHGGIAGGHISVGRAATDDMFRQLELTVQARLAKRLRLPAKAEFRRVFV